MVEVLSDRDTVKLMVVLVVVVSVDKRLEARGMRQKDSKRKDRPSLNYCRHLFSMYVFQESDEKNE
jgi:hypothetical protein